ACQQQHCCQKHHNFYFHLVTFTIDTVIIHIKKAGGYPAFSLSKCFISFSSFSMLCSVFIIKFEKLIKLSFGNTFYADEQLIILPKMKDMSHHQQILNCYPCNIFEADLLYANHIMIFQVHK